MNKEQVNEMLSQLSMQYQNFKITDELFDMWFDELQQYDFNDVIDRLKHLVSTGRYNYNPPPLIMIIDGLTKKHHKLDWKKNVVLCHFCNKGFNVDEKGYSAELKEHEDRCRSINYVIRQMKKWYGVTITRGELWALPKEEFDAKYDKLLHYIYEHTDNPVEKDVIGYIFNPPNEEKVKEIFGVE